MNAAADNKSQWEQMQFESGEVWNNADINEV